MLITNDQPAATRIGFLPYVIVAMTIPENFWALIPVHCGIKEQRRTMGRIL
jgi:hypothetical protein